jgi:FkbM family methyltransferase
MIIWKFKKLLRKFGVDIVYFPGDALRGRISLLKAHSINLLFDVGANEGQYAQLMRTIGYTGRIVSFEPLSSAFPILAARAKQDNAWEAVHMAIGDEDGEVEINIAANSQSSSILDMLPSHVQAAPDSSYIGREKVPIARIDSIARRYYREGDNLFLKVDTQGFERKVIEGASATLEAVRGIQLEMSIVELYQGEDTFIDMIAWLQQKGYELHSLEPGFREPNTGRLLQVDGIFFRK